MSERLENPVDIVEVEDTSEAPSAAMGAAACVSCVGCPFMQRCILPQAAEARAREAESQSNESTEPMAEALAGIDYAAALLDDDGPAVVWARAVVPAAPEPVLSERESPTSPTAEHDEGEAGEHREVPPPSWTMPVAVSEPELESVFDPDSATEPELALDPGLVPEAVPDPVPSLDPDPVSELVVEQELGTAPEMGAEPVLSDGIDVAPAVVCQEVRVAADQVETPVVSVSQPCIEPPVQMSTEQPTIEAHREPTAEASIEQAVEVSTELDLEANAAPNIQTIEYRPATAETVECGIPCQDPVVSWGATTYEEALLSQPEQGDKATLMIRDDGATLVSKSADFTVEVAPPMMREVMHELPDVLEMDSPEIIVKTPSVESVPVVTTPLMPDTVVVLGREDPAIESEQQSISASLAEAPIRMEHMPAGVNEHNTTNEEMGVIPPEAALSMASDEEIVCDEVLLSPAGVEMEEVDSRLGSEPYREALTNVVYNTTKRDDDTTLTGRDSDHAESEAPNAGYGASWLAALLGVVAVFTVVRRRSGAVY